MVMLQPSKYFTIFSMFLMLNACTYLDKKTDGDRVHESTSETRDAAFSNTKMDDHEGDQGKDELKVSSEHIDAKIRKVEIESRFDIAAKNLDARDFFRGLVTHTDSNIVVDPEVKGNISVNLRSVTIIETLKAVRDMYGFEFKQKSYGFQILPNRIQTRVLHFNYLDMKRSGQSSTLVSSGLSSVSEDESEGSSDGGTDSGSKVLSTRIRTETSTDFWKDLESSIQVILSGRKGRKVIVNALSGVIVVTGMPSEIASVERYLEQVQSSLHQQIIIEAKILEVELSSGFESGINWSKLNIASDGDTTLTSSASTKLAGADGLNGIFGVNVSSTNFDGVLELLETQGNVKVLSNPRVAAVNNQKAVIKVGSDEFFVTSVKSTTTTGTATTTTPEVILTPFFSGIALDVTPSIHQQEIIMHIHPSISKVVDQQKTITVANSSFSLPLAFSSIRESDSVVKAKSGEVIVLGGLLQTNTLHEKAGIPILSQIPYLNVLFTRKKSSVIKSELVILLRPLVKDEYHQSKSYRYLDNEKVGF